MKLLSISRTGFEAPWLEQCKLLAISRVCVWISVVQVQLTVRVVLVNQFSIQNQINGKFLQNWPLHSVEMLNWFLTGSLTVESCANWFAIDIKDKGAVRQKPKIQRLYFRRPVPILQLQRKLKEAIVLRFPFGQRLREAKYWVAAWRPIHIWTSTIAAHALVHFTCSWPSISFEKRWLSSTTIDTSYFVESLDFVRPYLYASEDRMLKTECFNHFGKFLHCPWQTKRASCVFILNGVVVLLPCR